MFVKYHLGKTHNGTFHLHHWKVEVKQPKIISNLINHKIPAN